MDEATLTLKPHQHRVLEEYTQLRERVTKLDEFLRANPTIDPVELHLLQTQSMIMHMYVAVLARRLALWGIV